jgi:hypothetical protein
MIHRDGGHDSPGLVDEAATCSSRRTDTHRPLESGYLPNQGRHVTAPARHGAGATADHRDWPAIGLCAQAHGPIPLHTLELGATASRMILCARQTALSAYRRAYSGKGLPPVWLTLGAIASPTARSCSCAAKNNPRINPAHLYVKDEVEEERRRAQRCTGLHPSRSRHFEQSAHCIRYVRNHLQQNALEAVTCCICPIRDICNDSAVVRASAWPKRRPEPPRVGMTLQRAANPG